MQIRHIFIKDHTGEDLNVISYQNMPNLHNQYKSAERKISKKIRNIRLLQGMTQEEFSCFLGIGYASIRGLNAYSSML
jgi:DNA-binding transcriptional regulator YiaG